MRDGMKPQDARAMVEARLGRTPQDALEAAVALEAWAGVPADAALRLGASLMRASPRRREWSAARSREPPAEYDVLPEAVAATMTLVAVAAWAPPLADGLGPSAVDTALRLSLPSALALQWALQRRYLGGRDGLGRLAHDRVFLWLVPLGWIGVPFLLFGLPGALGGLLVTTWLAGAVLARRGWSLWYALLVVVVAFALRAHLPALGVVGGAAAAALIAAALAVASVSPAARRPSPWRRAVPAAAIGAGVGVLLALDSSVGWGTRGPLPALALLPAAMGSLWGSYHLSRLRTRVPAALRGISIFEPESGLFGGAALVILFGAVVRLVSAVGALSVALVYLARWTGPALGISPSLFVGFGCLALVTLMATLLEALGSARWALVSLAAAVAGELAFEVYAPVQAPGAALAFGAAIGVLIALPPSVALLRRPARLLAATLWID